ncbi:MAG: hypothetical protein K2P57_05310 [Burkholderiales bacterium]|nr:hypothetical protein [Burkholderiales bacterium]
MLRPIPTPRLDLSSVDDCRKELARVYRDARHGNIDPADASRLAFILAQIAKLIEIGDLEMRIKTLEGRP